MNYLNLVSLCLLFKEEIYSIVYETHLVPSLYLNTDPDPSHCFHTASIRYQTGSELLLIKSHGLSLSEIIVLQGLLIYLSFACLASSGGSLAKARRAFSRKTQSMNSVTVLQQVGTGQNSCTV